MTFYPSIRSANPFARICIALFLCGVVFTLGADASRTRMRFPSRHPSQQSFPNPKKIYNLADTITAVFGVDSEGRPYHRMNPHFDVNSTAITHRKPESFIASRCSDCSSSCCDGNGGGGWSRGCYEDCCPYLWSGCKPKPSKCAYLCYSSFNEIGPKGSQKEILQAISECTLCLACEDERL